MSKLSEAIEKLRVEVQENTSRVEGAVVLLNQLAELVRENADDPAAIEEIAAIMDANSMRLAAAIEAHTPNAEPTPVPTPITPPV